jgi:hypothetical protein
MTHVKKPPITRLTVGTLATWMTELEIFLGAEPRYGE